MARIAYFFERRNDRLVAELEKASHTVSDAKNLDEAFNLIDHDEVDIAIISPEAWARGNPIHSKIKALQLRHKTTAAEVIVELAQLFPGEKTRVQ